MEMTLGQTMQQGMAAHKEGNLQDAERLYQAILKSRPLHPDANHNLGLIAVSLNKADAALPLFKIALEAKPEIEQYWLSYIDALIAERQFENANRAIKKGKKKGVAKEKLKALTQKLLLVKAGNTPAQGLSQAEIQKLLNHYQSGRYDDAEKMALLITQEFPEHQFPWKVLGALFEETGRKSDALTANEKSVQLEPQDAEAHYNLGNTLLGLDRLEEAEANFKQAILLRSDFALAHYNLGITLNGLGRLEEAEASYRKAISLKLNYAEVHSNLGITLIEIGRLREAEASFRQAITLKSDYAEAHNNLGIALKDMDRLDEAEASYRHAIALKPDYAEAHRNLGVTLYDLGRLEEAEESYTHAIALKADFTTALMNRWQLLFDKGEFDTALRDADSCNTRESRACGLETLYALGRIDEIYKRIEIYSGFDDTNIRMAAFSSFISEQEKKETAHKFCRNPLSFIYFSNISSHLENSTEFIKETIDELKNVKATWEPLRKTTHKGFQTSTNINLFSRSSEKITQLKSIILDELNAYYLKFQNESCSYIKQWPSKKDLVGWHVILKQQGYQDPHMHPSGWLSGVIYLKVVPPLGKDEGAIEFSLNSPSYSDPRSPNLTHQPELGDIVFFPSSLHHRTIPFTTNADRIIVSFDLMPQIAR